MFRSAWKEELSNLELCRNGGTARNKGMQNLELILKFSSKSFDPFDQP
jgi:hypothetical protein